MRLLLLFIALALPLTASANNLEVKGQFKFISDAPVEKIFGTADGTTGKLSVDFADLTKTKGTIAVPVADMKTGNDTRDEHLKGPEWLDAKQFASITFAIETVKQVSRETKGEVTVAKLEATGAFTLHGVAKEMTVPVTIKWKGNKAKVSTKFDVALKDFNVKGTDGVVGKKVGTTIQVEGSLVGEAK